MKKRCLTSITLALALTLAAVLPAAAETEYYQLVYDTAFSSYTWGKLGKSGSGFIKEWADYVLPWINNNTDAKTGFYAIETTLWSSPAAFSSEDAFMKSLADYSTWERCPDRMRVGFTGKKTEFRLQGLAYSCDNGWPYPSIAFTSSRCEAGVCDSESSVKKVASHELGHLLRKDGVHHSDSRACAMDSSRSEPGGYFYCNQSPNPCVTRINQVR